MTWYETPKAIAREKELMAAIAERYKCECVDLPPKYIMDALLIRGDKALGFIEIKTRSFASTEYPSMMVNLHKVLAASNLTNATGLKCKLLVEWTDRIGIINFDAEHDIGLSRRTDRDDPVDLFAYYPISGFTFGEVKCN